MRDAASRELRPSSARSWQSRTRPTCDTSRPIRDGTVRETESPERSSSVWQAVSAAGRSRRPHASVSSKPGISAQPAASCSTSCTPTAIAACPRRDLVDFGRELFRVVSDDLDEQPHGVGIGLDAAPVELRRDPFGHTALRHVEDKDVAGLRAGFRERRVLLQLRGDECEHRVRRRAREVGSDSLGVGRLPALDLFDDHEPAATAEAGRASCTPRRRPRRRLVRGEQLDGVLADPVAETPQGARRSSVCHCR